MGQIIIISLAILWSVCFCIMPFIALKAINYVKNKYPQEWDSELKFKIGTSVFGGKTMFQLFEKFDDPVIDNLKNKWNAALRRLLFSVLFSFFVIATYIYILAN